MRISLFCAQLRQLIIITLLSSGFMLSASANTFNDTLIASSKEAKYTLSPSDIKSPFTRLELTTPTGKQIFELTENTTLLDSAAELRINTEFTVYKGKIIGADNSWARFTDNNGKLSGAYFDGKNLYFVSQQTQVEAELEQVLRFNEHGADLLIYNANQIRHSGTCALHDADMTEAFSYHSFVDQLIQLTANAASKELKVSLTADVEFENSDAELASVEMIAEMNIVDGIFSEQVGVTISIDEIRVLNNNGPLTATDPVDLIIAYRDYVFNQYSNPGASHLFTGKNLDGSTIGIAYVGALCNSYAVGVTQRFGINTALVTAHEFGHNFGAPHDNQAGSACASTPGTFLMNPGINGSDQFSECSLVNMQPLVDQAQCLVDLTPPTIISMANTDAQVAVPYLYDADGVVEADGSGDISFTLDFGPEGMTVSPEGQVAWTPTEQQVGTQSIQITATSQYGSDSQLFEVEVIASPSVDFIDFNTTPITPFDSRQDGNGNVTVSPDGSSITLEGNRWVKIDFDYVITPETTIEFDYISTLRGEIHGIGLQSVARADSTKTFNIYGSQSWGLQSTRYTQVGQVQRISIPVGLFYTGAVNYLYFVMDHDVSSPNANGTYSNVIVSEPGQEPEPDPDPQDAIDFTQFSLTNYGANQNPNGAGFVEILDAGFTLRLEGNLWRKIEINQTLTDASVLEFDFKSSAQGEIHGIGFVNSNGVSAGSTFQLYGTQNWGISDFSYTGDGEYQKFIIPIGDYYQGEFRYLIFSMDNDRSNPDSESVFKNVRINQ